MTKSIKTPKRLLALLCTTALLAAMPLTFGMNSKTGAFGLKASVALAENNGGNHDSNGGNHDANGSGHDATGTSHDAAGTSHDATGTSHDATGTSHDATGTSHDAAGTNHDATGSSHDVNGSNGNIASVGGTVTSGANDGSSAGVPLVERLVGGVRVTMADGSSELVSNGVYEQLDASGRVIVQHTATQAELDRLAALR